MAVWSQLRINSCGITSKSTITYITIKNCSFSASKSSTDTFSFVIDFRLTKPILWSNYCAQCFVSAMWSAFAAKRLLSLFQTIPVAAAIAVEVLITPPESLNITWGDLSTNKSSPSFILRFNSNKYALIHPWMVLYIYYTVYIYIQE